MASKIRLSILFLFTISCHLTYAQQTSGRNSTSAPVYSLPDTDGDGVPDIEDSCPTVRGLREFHGCPDTDGDGVPDYLDECPTVRGDKGHAGCPDTDGDGLYDNEDMCPFEVGPKENKGCPWTDVDGDGILDKDDLCPNVKGIAKYHGCPEPVHLTGASQMMELYDSILFEPGKQEISAANLLRIKKFGQHMLNEDKAYDIQIIGHSDNQEADPSFLDQLSLDRAEAIRQILLQQGIASSRIMVDGYGPAQPAGDNNNPVARKFNRRVQLFIVVVTEQ